MEYTAFGNRLKRGLVLATAGAVLLTVLAGCGAKAAGSDDAGSASGGKTVIVGTGNAYEPYCYLDKNGDQAGYDYEVLKAVDELLPQYKFEFQSMDFKDVLLSLDAGKIDIGAHQYEWNEQRAAKYLFGKESYTTYTTYVTVKADNSTIHSLDDLQGKTVETSTGSNATYLLEKYNAEHKNNPIKLAYVDNQTDEQTVAGLQSGKWDATIVTRRDADKFNKAYGNGQAILKQVGKPVSTSKTYFVFAKDNTELQTAVDGALKKLKDSGKLKQISIDVVGGDYTTGE